MSKPAMPRPDQPAVVVAGHICLDLIPRLPADPRGLALRPGALDVIGPVTVAVGGSVGNTGIALHRLGIRTTLVARVGDDALGGVLVDLVRRAVSPEAALLLPTPGASTSCSVVLNRPGQDRAIAHYPGVNDTFVADDVPGRLLEEASLLHVGYPPLMAAMVADDGRELGALLERAHAAGAMTSLDMANANLGAGPGGVRWRALLRRVLPTVDVFLPSLAEAGHLLGRRIRRDEDGAPSLASIAGLADELLELGVAVAGVKLGERGLYVRTARAARLASTSAGLRAGWADRELHSAVFEADVVGTAGAGDTTIAGFLFALLSGRSPEDAVTIACAVGGASTEGPDGTSAVPAWAAIEHRLAAGWRRRRPAPADGWVATADGGLRRGPRDAG